MPKKTIYVADENLALYTRAEELGGESLSSVIADALRRYVDIKEAEAEGYEQHVTEVGRWGRWEDPEDTRKIKLIARVIAEQETPQWNNNRGRDIKVYQTRTGKIVIWWNQWTRWQGEHGEADYITMDSLPEYDRTIVGQAYGLILGHLPGTLIQEAAAAIGQEYIEVIE